MEIASKYNPAAIEDKWYKHWLEQGFFKGDAKRGKSLRKEPYCIVIPPPNVTGVLHMGHMLNNTIQDIMVRRARMQGKEAVWVPGTDHASIATEAKVVAMLKEKGIEKKDISRETFLEYAWEWKEKYGGIILQQLKKLGASCDWDRTRFTMEPELSEAVLDVFIDQYNKGNIYRGIRMVNWDPQGKTALSDDEVIFKENNARLYYVKYKLAGEDGYIAAATVRPETIMGDVAVCVHPDDERYKGFIGKKCIVPLVNREVPIIADDYIEMGFGTGALKVTPAHDINDYNLGIKHKLQVIDVLNDDGTISEAGQVFVGMDRFKARKAAVEQLESEGLLIKTEEIKNNIGTSERTGAVVEPRLSLQWFLKMNALSKPALDNVLNGNIKFHPEKFVNTYKHWMENVKDWCISRQLWWGHRIPAWNDARGNMVVCKTKEEALQKLLAMNPAVTAEEIRQDEDVLDTWFSSWLWPISVFDGFKDPNNDDVNYFYPTNDLVTAPEIIFFWVARMIIAGYEYKQELPFRNVYFTGIVRDKIGRKMSKSLGNSPEPIELIKKFGADAVRFGMLVCSPAGNDILFDEKYVEQGRNFNNKIWNAFRLIKGWNTDNSISSAGNETAIIWFREKLKKTNHELEHLYNEYRFSEALMLTYKLIWDDFCSWYLEMVKPAYGDPIDLKTFQATTGFFEHLMQLLHPVMPFITEELWHQLKERDKGSCIMVSSFPEYESHPDESLLEQASQAFELVTQVRNTRSTIGLSPKETLSLSAHEEAISALDDFSIIIKKLANIQSISHTKSRPANTSTIVIKTYEWFLHLPESAAASDKESLKKELEYTRGFLASVEAKLRNEKFISNAKQDLIEKEHRKKADAEAKIAALLIELGSEAGN
jgi:valyl-tRNA synthetase